MKEVIPFFALLLFSAMLNLAIIFYSWKKRTVTGAWPLVILAMCGFFWTFGYAFEILGISYEWMRFWHGVRVIGMVFVATAVLYFTLEYAGYYQWTRRPVILFLFTIPFVYYLLDLFNEYHEWIYIGQPEVIEGVLPFLSYNNNWLSRLHVQYSFFLVLLSGFVLVHKYFYSAKIYRQQILVILLGIMLPFVGAAVSLARFEGRFSVDYASFLLVISALIIAWGVFRYHLLDLMPITHTAVLANIQDGVIVLDAAKRIVDINPAATAFFGKSAQTLLGKSASEILPDMPDRAPGDTATMTTTVVMEREDDSEQILEIRCKPLRVKDEFPTGKLLVVHDATDRKLAERLMAERTTLLEEEVAARLAEIHLAEEKSEIILQNVQDAIGMADLNGYINYVNPSLLAMTGYEEAELLGVHAWKLMAGQITEQTWTDIKQTTVLEGHWQGEVLMRCKNDRTYLAHTMLAPVNDKDGRLVGYVSSHRDISRQKDFEKAQSQFISNISHELRTPVTNLKLYLQLMQTTALPEKRAHYEQTLHQQVDRLEKLIEDVLEISSLDLGGVQSDGHIVNIVDLVDNVLVQHRAEADQKQITISHLSEQAVKTTVTHGDYGYLELAICKLVDNAIRFTPEGGEIRLETAVAPFDGRDWIIIAIHDNGRGIAAEEQKQIFNRFYRGDMAESGDLPGTGLGLSVADHIIRLHGGVLAVESQLGKGSTFTVRLPQK